MEDHDLFALGISLMFECYLSDLRGYLPISAYDLEDGHGYQELYF